MQDDDAVKGKRKKFSCKMFLFKMHVAAILKPNP